MPLPRAPGGLPTCKRSYRAHPALPRVSHAVTPAAMKERSMNVWTPLLRLATTAAIAGGLILLLTSSGKKRGRVTSGARR